MCSLDVIIDDRDLKDSNPFMCLVAAVRALFPSQCGRQATLHTSARADLSTPYQPLPLSILRIGSFLIRTFSSGCRRQLLV